MIAFIRGQLIEITDTVAIVDVNGVGYEIACANPYDFQSHLNESVFIYTYYHVREDAHILYGFKDSKQKELFSHVLNVSGIGPKGALSIISHVTVDHFVNAIENEDEAFLTKFPGVGKKTARQMILDLKGKLPFQTVATEEALPVKTSGADFTKETVLSETVEALETLGYKDREIRTVLPQLKKSDSTDTDRLIKEALALLMKG
ncbi:Holliday junction DNA helicase subunit RuvA [Pelagirhabdus alkalitolerans]|uniref:Holliday junction branch migration complex subunit RuvA n=1 Tax=Pelagirhabdus alkalitolerans TaxID=1612202 RepID=A0A1G6HQG4_9BACI|nr:Holliday junction branch migration protein RuvA [Pelagirhabdus alkalitolerans]SDB96383.1 Holliday junction DNA helicase subunit RuvA [Pelagirhabdus alkalitolerans]